MTTTTSKAEHVIEGLAGCGMFQVTLILILFAVVKTMVSYSIMFMAFGSYNPGWRCLDNVTGSIPTNDTGGMGPLLGLNSANVSSTAGIRTNSGAVRVGNPDDVFGFESCDVFEKCSDVQFNPATSTVVSEFGLICDRAWTVKLVISMQMLGMLIGSYVCGQLSDRLGRKKALCVGVGVTSLVQLVSSFSVSWVMFLICRFFLGVSCTLTIITLLIYASEFMTRKWRAVVIALPVWYIGSSFMALASWIFKDWRNVEILGCVLNGLCMVPIIYWVPESLRWLEVKHKSEQFVDVSHKILRYNKKPVSDLGSIELTPIGGNRKDGDIVNKYTVLDLFRKGYRLITGCMMFLMFSFSLLYYALSFGVKSMHGDFYLNLLVNSLIPIPLGLLSMLAQGGVKRRVHTLIFMGVTIAGSIASVGILLSDNQTAKDIGSTTLISMSRGTLDVAWMGVFARNTELYPTVVRGLGLGLGSLSARIGGILAPVLIPNDKSVMYIFMIIMSVMAIVMSLVSLKLPETRGKALKQDFEEEAA